MGGAAHVPQGEDGYATWRFLPAMARAAAFLGARDSRRGRLAGGRRLRGSSSSSRLPISGGPRVPNFGSAPAPPEPASAFAPRAGPRARGAAVRPERQASQRGAGAAKNEYRAANEGELFGRPTFPGRDVDHRPRRSTATRTGVVLTVSARRAAAAPCRSAVDAISARYFAETIARAPWPRAAGLDRAAGPTAPPRAPLPSTPWEP